MIEKTKSGSRVGIALVGAFATIAGIGEIIVGLTGNYLKAFWRTAGTTSISENKIAASKPKRRIGCIVISAARSL